MPGPAGCPPTSSSNSISCVDPDRGPIAAGPSGCWGATSCGSEILGGSDWYEMAVASPGCRPVSGWPAAKEEGMDAPGPAEGTGLAGLTSEGNVSGGGVLRGLVTRVDSCGACEAKRTLDSCGGLPGSRTDISTSGPRQSVPAVGPWAWTSPQIAQEMPSNPSRIRATRGFIWPLRLLVTPPLGSGQSWIRRETHLFRTELASGIPVGEHCPILRIIPEVRVLRAGRSA